MKSGYLWIALFGLVCVLCCASAYGGSVGTPGTARGSECFFLNNLSLFGDASAMYEGQSLPVLHGNPPLDADPPDEAGNLTALCAKCHNGTDLVSGKVEVKARGMVNAGYSSVAWMLIDKMDRPARIAYS